MVCYSTFILILFCKIEKRICTNLGKNLCFGFAFLFPMLLFIYAFENAVTVLTAFHGME